MTDKLTKDEALERYDNLCESALQAIDALLVKMLGYRAAIEDMAGTDMPQRFIDSLPTELESEIITLWNVREEICGNFAFIQIIEEETAFQLTTEIKKIAIDDRLTLEAIGLFLKLKVLSFSTIEDDRTDSIHCSGVRSITLDECLQSVFESDFSCEGKTFDREFESLIAELERCEYLTKSPIVLPGQGVSHSYRFVEETS